MSEIRVKKAVIKEDLLAITGDFRKAIILNQFIYWSERVSDADKFIEKENEIAKNNGEEERELFYGWIYKTADELAEEVMLGLSASQIRRYVSDLVSDGYISKRTNPKYKWDRTLQYRVNLVKIAKALKEKGYPLSDYRIDIPDDENTNTHPCKINDEQEKDQSQSSEQAIPENINKEYNNRDYHTENTNGRNINKVNGEVDTTFSKKSLPTATPKKTRAELEKLEQNMIKRFYAIGKQYDVSDNGLKNVSSAFVRYLKKYTENTGKIHPILTDKTLEKIFITMASVSDTECGHFDFIADEEPNRDGVSYLDMMVDEHFQAEHSVDTDWHISHFANQDYLDRMAQHVVEW